jgi:hypothetical protein
MVIGYLKEEAGYHWYYTLLPWPLFIFTPKPLIPILPAAVGALPVLPFQCWGW